LTIFWKEDINFKVESWSNHHIQGLTRENDDVNQSFFVGIYRWDDTSKSAGE